MEIDQNKLKRQKECIEKWRRNGARGTVLASTFKPLH
jgi:hypothetical protein